MLHVSPSLCSFFLMLILCGCNSESPLSNAIDSWGSQTQREDLIFSQLLLHSSDGVAQWRLTPVEFNSIVSKCLKNQHCLKNVLGAFRLMQGPISSESSDSDEEWLMARFFQHSSQKWSRERDAVNVLVAARMFSNKEWLKALDWMSVENRWKDISQWIDENKYYVIYDCDLSVFVIDEECRRTSTRVPPESPTWSRCGAEPNAN